MGLPSLPLGGCIGHIFRLGRLPVNAHLATYYNVVWPGDGPTWQPRAQVQRLFRTRAGPGGARSPRDRATLPVTAAPPRRVEMASRRAVA